MNCINQCINLVCEKKIDLTLFSSSSPGDGAGNRNMTPIMNKQSVAIP